MKLRSGRGFCGSLFARAWDCRIQPAASRVFRGWQARKGQRPLAAVRDVIAWCREDLEIEPSEILAHPVDAAMVLAETGGSVGGVPVRACDPDRVEPRCMPGIYFVEIASRAAV